MEESKKQLEIQIVKVLELLKRRLEDDPNRPILKTLYDRYDKAQKILLYNEDTKKIIINGGCRAYLDAFSDYMNPLLIEMDKAEELVFKLNQ
ncbi:hypothetical protein R2R35_05085 [Anaerocolumna sp. AGMB13020]|uniref:hypothetical protein n=1 Tax=Anaerocolumna sp. AGMB13020 TaxID=3081750 RepID=UPI0029529A40|nr:hypothetical protein [Anaerocolumna sp. AGMB13020]WOO37879.1 hypothetical protein R2R35_05085 [Anaerocolumna sp. AGMB13020]